MSWDDGATTPSSALFRIGGRGFEASGSEETCAGGEGEPKTDTLFWGGDRARLFHARDGIFNAQTRASVFPACSRDSSSALSAALWYEIRRYLKGESLWRLLWKQSLTDTLVREGAGVHANADERGMKNTCISSGETADCSI